MTPTLPPEPLSPVRAALRRSLGYLPPSTTVDRWIRYGVWDASGHLVKLRAWRVGRGGHWRTSEALAAAFVAAVLVEGGVDGAEPVLASGGAAGD